MPSCRFLHNEQNQQVVLSSNDIQSLLKQLPVHWFMWSHNLTGNLTGKLFACHWVPHVASRQSTIIMYSAGSHLASEQNKEENVKPRTKVFHLGMMRNTSSGWFWGSRGTQGYSTQWLLEDFKENLDK